RNGIKLVGEHPFAVVEQPPDQRRLAVIHGTGRDQAQHSVVGGGEKFGIGHGVHQKYPSFLRRSIEASEVWSSMRVAPRSVMSVTAVSAMMACGSAASDATGQVHEMSPTVRNRTDRFSTRSPSRGGVNGVTGTRRPLRRTKSRRCA